MERSYYRVISRCKEGLTVVSKSHRGILLLGLFALVMMVTHRRCKSCCSKIKYSLQNTKMRYQTMKGILR